MKTLLAAAGAAMVVAVMSVGSAGAEPYYRHPEPGIRVIIGGDGPRYHRRHHHEYRPHRCWTEKERFRDHHGRLHVRSVRVCR